MLRDEIEKKVKKMIKKIAIKKRGPNWIQKLNEIKC
jgi:hypothetical protein